MHQGFAARLLIFIFRSWQLSFSVLIGSSCRFQPTCSAYGIEAVRRHGAFHGLRLTLRRIGRCHPLGGHGHDPVPPSLPQQK